MGYNGMGYQRWIATLKPRKFLAKRSKPDGGGMDSLFERDINDYYHLKSNKLENLKNKEFPPEYREQLEKEIKHRKRKQIYTYGISLLITIIVFVSLLIYLSKSFEWF